MVFEDDTVGCVKIPGYSVTDIMLGNWTGSIDEARVLRYQRGRCGLIV